MQSLITLSLSGNKIGEKGALHLAQALQTNMVRLIVFCSLHIYNLFSI